MLCLFLLDNSIGKFLLFLIPKDILLLFLLIFLDLSLFFFKKLGLLIVCPGENHTSEGMLLVLRRANNIRKFNQQVCAEMTLFLGDSLSFVDDSRLVWVIIISALFSLFPGYFENGKF